MLPGMNQCLNHTRFEGQRIAHGSDLDEIWPSPHDVENLQECLFKARTLGDRPSGDSQQFNRTVSKLRPQFRVSVSDYPLPCASEDIAMATVIIFCAIMPVNDQQYFKRFVIVFLW